MWNAIALSLQKGNGYVITILVLSFISLVIFFERAIMLQAVYNINFGKFLTNLKKMIAAEDLDRAINLCKNTSSTSLPRIALKALEAAETDPSKIRSTLEEESIEFIPSIERRLSALPALTLLIMLCGILGTIDALWTAFASAEALDNAKAQATLAQGISASLNPTAIGLIFSMSLLALYYLLKGMATNLVERMHYGVAVLSNLLVPQNAVAYMAQAASSVPEPSYASPPVAAPAAAVASAPAPDAAPPPPAVEEAFDEPNIDDIKDEEEII
jgi:biopolymer transport protein ExbB/TolQ